MQQLEALLAAVRYLSHRRDMEARYAKLLLRRGRMFTERATSADYQEAKAWSERLPPLPDRPYMNSQLFVLDNPRSLYYEGYCSLSSPIQQLHAWVVMPDGRVLDPTLEAAAIPQDMPVAYLGMHVPTHVIASWILKRGGLAEAVVYDYRRERAKGLRSSRTGVQ